MFTPVDQSVCAPLSSTISKLNPIFADVHACCGSWPCFCDCFCMVMLSARLTYHYSLKYSTGGIPELPARNVAAAFVWNAENSSRSRGWNLDEWALLSMSRGKVGQTFDFWRGYFLCTFSRSVCPQLHKITQIGSLKWALRNAAFNCGEFRKG